MRTARFSRGQASDLPIVQHSLYTTTLQTHVVLTAVDKKLFLLRLQFRKMSGEVLPLSHSYVCCVHLEPGPHAVLEGLSRDSCVDFSSHVHILTSCTLWLITIFITNFSNFLVVLTVHTSMLLVGMNTVHGTGCLKSRRRSSEKNCTNHMLSRIVNGPGGVAQ